MNDRKTSVKCPCGEDILLKESVGNPETDSFECPGCRSEFTAKYMQAASDACKLAVETQTVLQVWFDCWDVELKLPGNISYSEVFSAAKALGLEIPPNLNELMNVNFNDRIEAAAFFWRRMHSSPMKIASSGRTSCTKPNGMQKPTRE